MMAGQAPDEMQFESFERTCNAARIPEVCDAGFLLHVLPHVLRHASLAITRNMNPGKPSEDNVAGKLPELLG